MATTITIQLPDSWFKQPRRMRLKSGKWVGVGGPIVIPDAPPRVGYTVPEATSAQYKELAKRLPKIIKVKETPKEEE